MTIRLDEAEETALWDAIMSFMKATCVGFDPASVPRRPFKYDGDYVSVNVDASPDGLRMTVINPSTFRTAA